MAAEEPRQRHPAARPQAEAPDRLIGVLRAGRQVPALKADQGREGVAIDSDEAAPGHPGGAPCGVEDPSRTHCLLLAFSCAPTHSAATAPRRLASIWLIASTTASKVSIVEAWRAL